MKSGEVRFKVKSLHLKLHVTDLETLAELLKNTNFEEVAHLLTIVVLD